MLMQSPVDKMLSTYVLNTAEDKKNALKEIVQELALLGLYRAGLFNKAAFYGGTALRIFYGSERFSEDLDFSLDHTDRSFKVENYLQAVKEELAAYGFTMSVEKKIKQEDTQIQTASIKGGTLLHLIKITGMIPPVSGVAGNEQLNIKLEIDIEPPAGAGFEIKYQLLPVSYSVRLYDLPSLFAGKLHAVLCRNWKNRIKGRDFFDYIFYLSKNVPLNIYHLEQRMRQSGHWEGNSELKLKDLMDLLNRKFSTLDYAQAAEDVKPFITNAESLKLWSADFFTAVTKDRLQVV
jgi:predicted nucleotidyltransferase component of viral defense system